MRWLKSCLLIFALSFPLSGMAQQSVARLWNEALLEAIRNDFARPTVHARNLFHVSAIMYDAWAAYDNEAKTFFLGHSRNGYSIPFDQTKLQNTSKAVREEAISYAAYRLLMHRFAGSPHAKETLETFNLLMEDLGYDSSNTDTDYSKSGAGLGNYLAEQVIEFGLSDGANESFDYVNQYYSSVNEALHPDRPGVQEIEDANRWQPLAFGNFIDQSGNEVGSITPDFLCPEWGNVFPFSLDISRRISHKINGFDFNLYHDPGPPPTLGSELTDEYKWTFSMVSVWSSHHGRFRDTLIDISPASMGNIDIQDFPKQWGDYDEFYKFYRGGDIGKGYKINPITQRPYQPQVVRRSDYSRVLAEFWADGPDSETPPGHWFTILNYVNDHPQFQRRFKGEGAVIDQLEWDVKSYLALGGAMHDVAVATWAIKGYYDFVRPISALRYMADKGQSSDRSLPRYHKDGIKLIEGYIEMVGPNDPLVGNDKENLNKIKLLSWKGPEYIDNPEVDEAGVGWILAENWWPYQRPTFVTPPFAGYLSGHSTFSRAAAEVLTALTGSAYFPGGMGEFYAKKNEFLVFEEGPSMDVILQWATYRDAADQCSLSRIWGGIHPPADDIKGRILGEKIGKEAFQYAESLFNQGH